MPDDPIPLREAATDPELDCSTTMLRRAWRDDVLELVQAGRGLAIERAELERVREECRCSVCGGLTLGKLHPDGKRYCEAHRGKANRGKSIADGTRKETSEYRISDAEVERRRAAMRAVAKKVRTDRTAHQAVLDRRQATRRQDIDRAKADGGEVVFDVAELGARVGRSATTVTEHIRQGLAQPDVPRPEVSGRHPYLLSEDAFDAYKRLLAAHPDGRMQRFVGDPGRKGRSAAEDLTEIVMRGAPLRAVRERVTARRNLRQGLSPGRPDAHDRHAEWADAVGELVDYYERLVSAGQLEKRLGLWRICGELAGELGSSQAAIYKAVKALETGTN